MSEFSVTGGAGVGWVNATWPFAKLTTSSEQLRLSVFVLGSYVFSPSDVISLERYGSIPFLSSGIRINHCRSDLPRNMVFWTLGNPEKLLLRIREVGFTPSAPISAMMPPRGFPVRIAPLLLAIILGNGLFALDQFVLNHGPHEPGISILIALVLAFLLAWGIGGFPWLQSLVLREGHSVGEIKSFLLLFQFVSGILVVGFIVSYLSRTYAG